jgi:hypothetical protein
VRRSRRNAITESSRPRPAAAACTPGVPRSATPRAAVVVIDVSGLTGLDPVASTSALDELDGDDRGPALALGAVLAAVAAHVAAHQPGRQRGIACGRWPSLRLRLKAWTAGSTAACRSGSCSTSCDFGIGAKALRARRPDTEAVNQLGDLVDSVSHASAVGPKTAGWTGVFLKGARGTLGCPGIGGRDTDRFCAQRPVRRTGSAGVSRTPGEGCTAGA